MGQAVMTDRLLPKYLVAPGELTRGAGFGSFGGLGSALPVLGPAASLRGGDSLTRARAQHTLHRRLTLRSVRGRRRGALTASELRLNILDLAFDSLFLELKANQRHF
jgi:hypothetical protein